MQWLAAWRDYHRDNRQVFDLFIRFAREAKRAGKKRYSARAIVERIRWEVEIVAKTHDEFKINNNHCAYYARLAMLLYPSEIAGFFVRRDTRFDGTDAEILAANKLRDPGQLF